MKKMLKRSLAVMLAMIMVFGGAPLGSLMGISGGLGGLRASAAHEWLLGDICSFGSYPQTQVTDSALLTLLNAIPLTWVSYGYYESCNQSDFMKYADVTYEGEKYRAVTFSGYRPNISVLPFSSANSNQDENGFFVNNVYWFKYEPLLWRVLDPATGLLMSKNIIDSQAYCNLTYNLNGYYFNNTACTVFANDYATSSVRTWLNGNFWNTAFSNAEQSEVITAHLDNSACDPYYNLYDSDDTDDKLFLLSYPDILSSAYGFSPDTTVFDTARKASGSDYAKCQGLGRVFSRNWWLRSPGNGSSYASGIWPSGSVDCEANVYLANIGILPAFRISDLSKTVFLSHAVPVTAVSVSPKSLSLFSGDSSQLTAYVEPFNATVRSVIWSSDNEAVAAVSETGVVNAISAGTAAITVTSEDGGFYDTCEITVRASEYAWDGSVAEAFAGGSGTNTDPYLIETEPQLKFFASSVNAGTDFEGKYITLINDMTLNPSYAFSYDEGGNITGKADGRSPHEWDAIGRIDRAFRGSFDGGGHTIRGIYINTTGNYQGLFGYVDEGAVINTEITGSYISGSMYVGGLAGYSNGTIRGCVCASAVTGSDVGGIAGKNLGLIVDSSCIGNINASNSAGGITAGNNGTVENSSCSGNVTGTKYSGGIAGAGNGKINKCRNAALIKGNTNSGGIIGSNTGTISECINEGQTTCNDISGGIVGNNGGTIIKCINEGRTTNGVKSGGIAGNNTKSGEIHFCRNNGVVSGIFSNAGGIAGYNLGVVTNCCSTGDVSGSGNVGGVAGYNDSGAVINCYSTGVINGSTNAGGVVGYNKNGGAVNCRYLFGTAAGGISGSDVKGQSQALTDSEMKNAESFDGWDFHNIWTLDGFGGYEYPQLISLIDKSFGGQSAVWDGAASEGFARGSGSNADPYIIENAEQLAFFANSVNGGNPYTLICIKLAENIVLNDYYATYWTLNAKEWTPIGTSNKRFSGLFDGGGHTISGIYINAESDYQGLFGNIYYGKIENLTISDSFIRGGDNVGGIVGYTDYNSKISGCKNRGSIIGNKNVGGISGYSDGNISGNVNEGIIFGAVEAVGGVVGLSDFHAQTINCVNNGKAFGYRRVGGIVGFCDFCSKIKESRNTGTVAGSQEIGGIAGLNDGEIIGCINKGIINGSTDIGGAAGYCIIGSVCDSLNSGEINGVSNVGGIAGTNETSIIKNSCNSGIVNGTTNVGGVTGYNKGYDYEGTFVFDSSNRGAVNGKYRVGGVSGSNDLGTINNCSNSGNVCGSNGVGGLSGVNNDGNVYNSFNSGFIKGDTSVGGMVGSSSSYLIDSEIIRCCNAGDVSGTNYIGGISGTNGGMYGSTASIIDCFNTGSVSGEAFIGGVAGSNTSYVISTVLNNCYSTGSVTGTVNTGGIAGSNKYTGDEPITLEYPCSIGIDCCFYLSGTAEGGINGSNVPGIADALTDAGMKTQSSFTNWDFVSAWTMDGNPEYLYPELQGMTFGQVQAASVSLSQNEINLIIEKTQQLTAEVSPSGALNGSVVWSSGNSAVAEVSDSGLVTAVAAGTATITVTAIDGGFTDTCIVTVEPIALTLIEVETLPDKTDYYAGETLDATGLTIAASYNDDTTETISNGFDCSPTLLNTAGIQTITVTYGGMCCTFDVTVNRIDADGFSAEDIPDQTFTGFALTPSPSVNYGDKTLQLGTDYTLTYNNNIKVGTAKVIIAGIGNFCGTKTLTFGIVPIKVENISVSYDKLSLNQNETKHLRVFFNPADATNQKVIWSSSNSDVAAVNSYGIVTAKKAGTAVITATSVEGGYTAMCTVTVKYTWWQWIIKIILFGWIWY